MNQEMQQEAAQDLAAGPDAAEVAAQAAATSAPQVGTLLIEARERINLSAADLARQLRLALRQVQALEDNRFDDLPGNTFVRGFIRNYARAVQADPSPLLAAYERNRPQPAPIEVSRHSEAIAFPSQGAPKWIWYSGGVILLLVLAPVVIYLMLQDDGRTYVSRKKDAPAMASPAVPANTQAPLALPMPQAVPQNTAPDAAAAQAPASPPHSVLLPPAASPAPQPNAASAVPVPAQAAAAPAVSATPFSTPASPKETPLQAGEVKVTLAFDGDAWVEMRDRSGKIVFSRLSRRGEVQAVQGKAPFNVVVGNAAQVRITYNDKPFDLAPHTKVNVARFKLE